MNLSIKFINHKSLYPSTLGAKIPIQAMFTQGKTTEESVGARCFVNRDGLKMSGIIKHRYSDFLVNEIDRTGTVLHLTSIDPQPEPPLPPVFEQFMRSPNQIMQYEINSEAELANIYYKYPKLAIRLTNRVATIEKGTKARARPIVWNCILAKENMTEQEAVSRLCRALQCNKGQIKYAGTKDRRGITTQEISISNVPIEKLLTVGYTIDHLRIGMFSQAITPLTLGANQGNRFTIVLRDIKFEDSSVNLEEGISQRMSSLCDHGFINYFGMQRFGTTTLATHTVGRMVLRREFDKIINALLTPLDDEERNTHQAKITYQNTHDPSAARKELPKSATIEATIFDALIQNGNRLDNPQSIWNQIDQRSKTFYIHAYQAYLWNHQASLRFEADPEHAMVGDYVMIDGEAIRISSQEEASRYSIYDIVLPLANGKTTQKEIVNMMEMEGIKLEMWDNLPADYGIHDDYRKLLVKPGDCQWEIIRHNNHDDNLIESDIDRLEGRSFESNRNPDGKFVSLCVSFSLESGMYATMCLRELLGRSTEWWSDSALSKKHGQSWVSSHCLVC